MANHDLSYTPDPDADSISSDVIGFNGILVSTQIPTRADGSLELGDITAQSECTLQALKVALEKAGSSMDRVMHLTIYLTDMADRAAFNEVYKRFFAKPWPVRAAVGVASLAVDGMRVEVTAMAAKARSHRECHWLQRPVVGAPPAFHSYNARLNRDKPD